MDSPRKLPSKKEVLETYLERDSARLFLDPRKDGVVVPKHLAKQAELVLRIGLDLRPPIPDLEIGDDGVTATLSFNKMPFRCTLPWSAMFAIISDEAVDNRGVVWPEDVPVESQLLAPVAKKPKLEAVPKLVPREGQPRPPKRRAPAALQAPKPLLAHRTGETEGGGEAGQSADAPKRTKRELPPYLRVVK